MAVSSICGIASANHRRFRFLTSSNAYDRAAILRRAWSEARRYPGGATRKLFRHELRRAWDMARGEREMVAIRAQGDLVRAAMAAGTLAQPTAIEAARSALFFAEHNDTNIGHELVARARVRLAALQAAA